MARAAGQATPPDGHGPGALSLCVASAVMAGLLLALMETAAQLTSPVGRVEGPTAVLLFVGYVTGTLVLAAAAIGVVQGLLLRLYPSGRGPLALLRGAARWFLGEGAWPGHGVARVVATSVVFVLTTIAGAAFVWTLLRQDDPSPASVAASVCAVLVPAGALAAAFWVALLGLLGRLADGWSAAGRSLPEPRYVVLALSACVVGAGLAALWLTWDTLRLLDLRGVAFGCTFAGVQALVAGLLLARRWRWPYGVSRTLLVAGILAVQTGWLLLFHIDDVVDVKVATIQDTVVVGPLLLATRSVLDLDGDGHSALMGGGDCDDSDPLVFPGAADVPGNGVDEDCIGGDRKPPPPPPPPPPPGPDRTGPAPGKRWSFLFVTADAVRWDRVGAYGHTRETTPRVDTFAQGATLFERAWSQAPQTKASIPSMLSGRYFSEVYRSKDLWVRVYPENVMFPELLHKAGYKTIGVLGHPFFRPRHGCHQGFETWDLTVLKQFGRKLSVSDTSTWVTDRAIEHLSGHVDTADPVFLWVHYYDPHHPYVQHEGVPRFGRRSIDRYDAEVANTDLHIGRLLDWLDGTRFADEMVVVYHSDHGEGFGEHGYVYHGIHIFEDQLRIPLIIRVPGQPGRRVETPVGLVDLAPTVLELSGIQPTRKLQGTSLVGWLFGNAPASRPPVFSEMVKDSKHSSRKVLIDWPWKLHHSVTYNYDELFNLAEDPAEKKNRIKTDPEVYGRLRERLFGWMADELEEIPAGPRRNELLGRKGRRR